MTADRRRPALEVAPWLLLLSCLSAAGPVGAACGTYAGQCGERTPAIPVPQCVNGATADAVSCTSANAVQLWSASGFRPADTLQLPAKRDSTSRYAGLCIPGESSGLELFRSLDIAGDVLFSSYNAGVQAWDIAGANAANPLWLDQKDGWGRKIWGFPGASEQLNFIQGISALKPASGPTFVAASGISPVGTTLWEFNNTSNTFRQIYQDGGSDTRDVKLFEHLGNVYAVGVAQAQSSAVVFYDVTAAKALRDANVHCCQSCNPAVIQEPAAITSCGGTVRLGALPGNFWNRYVDAMVVNGRLYVVTSDGFGVLPDIWELTFPLNPSNAVKRWDSQGITNAVRGVEFFENNGTRYLAWVRSKTIEIYNVNSCLDTDGCTSLGTPVFTRAVRNVATAEEFLFFSRSGSTPFLYYGIQGAGTGRKGKAIEQLLDLTNLGTTAGNTGSIPEITAGGGTYLDPGCNGLADATVDYWGRYYPYNQYGLNEVEPHAGRWNGNYFYRAAESILDVHVKGSGGGGGTPTVTSTAVTGAPRYVGDPITFSAQALNCDGAGNWQWNADVVPTTGLGSVTSTSVLTWPLCGPTRCDDEAVEVWAVKETCSGHPQLVINAAEIDLVDPRPEIASLNVAPVSPTSTYPLCTSIDLSSSLLGKPAFGHAWTIRRVGISGPPGEVASSALASWSWDTSGVVLDLGPEVFESDFETGDVSEWSSAVNLLSGTDRLVVENLAGPAAAPKGATSAQFEIQLLVTNATLATDVATKVVTLTSLGALGFDNPAVSVQDLGGGAYRFTANSQSATEWRWEFADPANGSPTGCQHFASCQVLDFSQDAQVVDFAWTPNNTPGNFGVAVKIRNCEDTQGLAHSFVQNVPVITAPEPPTVTSFTVSSGPPTCATSLGFSDCKVNMPITFAIGTTNNPAQLEFDWDWDFGAGNVDQTVTAAPTVQKTYTTTGPYFPRVRARTGALVSGWTQLTGSLNIVP